MALTPACIQSLALQAALARMPCHDSPALTACMAAVGPDAETGRGGAESPGHGVLMENAGRSAARQLACIAHTCMVITNYLAIAVSKSAISLWETRSEMQMLLICWMI